MSGNQIEEGSKQKPMLGCVSLIGDLAYLGKHVYFKDMGFTMCGCPTVNYDRDSFKEMPEGFPSPYNIEEWDITCERCLELMDMIQEISDKNTK